MSEITRFQHRNELSPQQLFALGLPIGVGIAGGVLESVATIGLAIVAFIASGVWIYCTAPPKFVAPRFEEYRDSDHSLWYRYSFVAPVATLAAGPLLHDVVQDIIPSGESLPLAVQAAASGLYVATVAPWGLHLQLTSQRRIGKRRLRQVLAHPSLEGVTATRIEAAQRHRPLLAALCAVGAVDGGTVPAQAITRLLDVPLEEVTGAIEELTELDILATERIGLYAAAPKWHTTLTPLGVNCLSAQAR
ncbi:hypothetical protein [Corynebacterium lizhenjunii]|uniref:hypothetical protein n=1 Tax=Corynebacterium lizhenjunii TaxID=2709394 RepID=UPI0013EDB030|nr:hypothetical protein [Corynebacterium lizhenjunii]